MKFLVALLALLTGMTIAQPGEAQSRDFGSRDFGAREISAPVAAAQLLASAEVLSSDRQAAVSQFHANNASYRIDIIYFYINPSLPCQLVQRSDRARE